MVYYLNSVKSAFNKVDGNYFNLDTTYNRHGIVRERMFCYEFYHQMRCLEINRDNKILHGEIDKRGHPDFLQEDRRNPDFVIHKPGSFDQNFLVIEVKGMISKSNKRGVLKDFNTLLTFTGDYKYKMGIFVIYNHDFYELKQEVGKYFIKKRLNNLPQSKHIYILARKCPNSLCTEHKMSDLFDL